MGEGDSCYRRPEKAAKAIDVARGLPGACQELGPSLEGNSRPAPQEGRTSPWHGHQELHSSASTSQDEHNRSWEHGRESMMSIQVSPWAPSGWQQWRADPVGQTENIQHSFLYHDLFLSKGHWMTVLLGNFFSPQIYRHFFIKCVHTIYRQSLTYHGSTYNFSM